MKYRKVTAIVRASLLERVEQALVGIGVSGVSVTRVSGYGEYHNFYRSDMMSDHARLEIFCLVADAPVVARCIMDAAHIGQPGDGLVAVLPIEHLYHIRTKSPVGEADPDE